MSDTREALELSDQHRHVLISVNPKAGARSSEAAVEQLHSELTRRGMAVLITSSIDELVERADQWQAQGCLRAVVAAGGDGTAALIANRTRPGTPMTILPLGTENLLSKYLTLPRNPVSLAEALMNGVKIQLDAGCVESSAASGPTRQLFLLMAGCGFDAEVVRRMHEGRSGHINHLSYAKPILDSIRAYEYPELKVSCELEGGEWDTIRARWAFVVNLPRYAGGLSFVPQASGTDGLLNVCTFKQGSLLNGLYYLSGVILGQHQAMDDCVTRTVRSVSLQSDSPHVPFQLDGDPGGYLPVRITALPGRLTLIVPRLWAETHGFQCLPKTEPPD